MPYRFNATMDYPRKFTEYILAFGYTPTGDKRKGESFAHFGVTLNEMEWLAKTLFDIVHGKEYSFQKVRDDGVIFEFYELVTTPQGQHLPLFSAWFLRHDSNTPHLVTAYPRSKPYKGKRV